MFAGVWYAAPNTTGTALTFPTNTQTQISIKLLSVVCSYMVCMSLCVVILNTVSTVRYMAGTFDTSYKVLG